MELLVKWDKAALLEALKAEGLPMLEDGAEKVLKVVSEWTEKSLVLEGGLLGAIALPVLAIAKPMIQEQIDKIDGIPG